MRDAHVELQPVAHHAGPPVAAETAAALRVAILELHHALEPVPPFGPALGFVQDLEDGLARGCDPPRSQECVVGHPSDPISTIRPPRGASLEGRAFPCEKTRWSTAITAASTRVWGSWR